MAKKKEEKPKVTIERVYNIPLRKEFQKAPKYKRAKKAANALRSFLVKHMKSENVKIGKYLNLELWKHGIKNPPHHVKVNAVKYDDGKVVAELVGAPVEEKKQEKKESAKKPKEELKEGEEKIKKDLNKLKEKTDKIKEEKTSTKKESAEPEKKEAEKVFQEKSN
jgi:large subunit ribosomal protein L31e